MKISRDLGEGWQELLASEYVDPRELKASSRLRQLAVVYLQEMRDKGRSEKTVPRYAAYVSEFLNFMERDGTAARVKDIDIRALKAFSSHLTRRQIRADHRQPRDRQGKERRADVGRSGIPAGRPAKARPSRVKLLRRHVYAGAEVLAQAHRPRRSAADQRVR